MKFCIRCGIEYDDQTEKCTKCGTKISPKMNEHEIVDKEQVEKKENFKIKPCNEEKPYIFVSYSSADREIVWRDVEKLQENGFNVWVDRENMQAGKTWHEKALEAISRLSCKVLIFYVSSNSLRSQPCLEELRQTRDEVTKRRHRGAVLDFIPIDVEPISNLVDYVEEIYDQIEADRNKKLSDKEREFETINIIMQEFFQNNNAVDRILSQEHPRRKKGYYEEIIQGLPECTCNQPKLCDINKECIAKVIEGGQKAEEENTHLDEEYTHRIEEEYRCLEEVTSIVDEDKTSNKTMDGVENENDRWDAENKEEAANEIDIFNVDKFWSEVETAKTTSLYIIPAQKLYYDELVILKKHLYQNRIDKALENYIRILEKYSYDDRIDKAFCLKLIDYLDRGLVDLDQYYKFVENLYYFKYNHYNLKNVNRYFKHDYVQSKIDEYLKKADEGYLPAYSLVAKIYGLMGLNDKERDCYLKLAEANDDDGQYEIGHLYELEGNYDKAIKYYELSAAQGNYKALRFLYKYYKEYKKNFEKALEYLEILAIRGFPEAQYRLGQYYQEGEVCQKDMTKAEYWYRKAKENKFNEMHNTFLADL